MNTIALIAHNSKKDDLVQFTKTHQPVLSRYHLIATGTTGQRIQEGTGLKIQRMESGPVGGDAQIAAQIVEGKVVAVIFLIDPLYAQPHEPDIQALLRICVVHNVPLATNLATATTILAHLARTRIAHLIFNPISGQGNAEQDLTLIQDLLSPHFHLHTHQTTADETAQQLAEAAVEAEADLIIASGGDGTVSNVAGVLLETDIPLGIIPRGTANAFATAMGISNRITPIRNACQVILGGKTQKVDAARCNGLPMILLAGIGYEAEMVNKASRELKDKWGVLAYLVAGWQQIDEQQLFTAQIEIEGKVQESEAGAITVANAAPPTSVMAQGMGEVIFDDGLLDLTITTANSRLDTVNTMLNMLGAALVKSEVSNPNIRHGRTQQIRISTDPPQKVVLDGEIIGTTPVEVNCIPQGLTVFVP
ncbi:methylglyoxal synthase [Spirulina sp. CS-785/01]|uniref:methylglyoxal synthase n=1 Tax=Spirulina sp. CS-785/01 TaxID=3021716 RepID=UPI00232FB459|nr:methylglyoxal synthase [Spirulina sp. CS-785/01]MDB9313462.1 methylglyoxal synthase [Spirulina sp. CS-785/01]